MNEKNNTNTTTVTLFEPLPIELINSINSALRDNGYCYSFSISDKSLFPLNVNLSKYPPCVNGKILDYVNKPYRNDILNLKYAAIAALQERSTTVTNNLAPASNTPLASTYGSCVSSQGGSSSTPKNTKSKANTKTKGKNKIIRGNTSKSNEKMSHDDIMKLANLPIGKKYPSVHQHTPEGGMPQFTITDGSNPTSRGNPKTIVEELLNPEQLAYKLNELIASDPKAFG